MSEKPYRPFDTALVMPDSAMRKGYRLVQPLIEFVFGFPEIRKIYNFAKGRSPAEFAQRCLDYNNITWSIPDEDLVQLQAIDGPIVINCNHPFGGADALSLMPLIEKLRPSEWKLFSNFIVADIPELRECTIPVDPLGGETVRSANRRGMVDAIRFLRSGGLLAIFPAGRVSHLDPISKAPLDQPWTAHAFRLAVRAGATIVTLHIPGQNSDRFLKVSPTQSRLRALMLCREMCRPNVQSVALRIAEIIQPKDLGKLSRTKQPAARLQAHCYLRADLDLPRPIKAQTTNPTKPTPEPNKDITSAFEELSSKASILKIADRDVLLFKGSDASAAVMNEIGRCRKIAFQAAGQGTKSDIDLTAEDPYYLHLVVWDRSTNELVGAYRMAKIQEIIAERGPQALYLDHIFDINPALYQELGAAFELSRSFVMPKFQRDNRALSALWRGLGQAALQHKCGTLFGSVTISNDYHPASRAILVEQLRRNYSDSEELIKLVTARSPFKPTTQYHQIVAKAYQDESIDALIPLIARIENDQRSVPPLMRYYCSLGAKFLAYHIEPIFQDALYCLLRVDLEAMDKRYRRRFLGA